MEYARTHTEETVYLVSSNTDDFGDGSSAYRWGEALGSSGGISRCSTDKTLKEASPQVQHGPA
ncbi:hypothetical protein AB0L47_25000 [Streptomyces bobili]|uniref:hypothetical protein n=1 Tax=Streptomyces bobili TaxID=67280 RepID=UPI0034433BEB